MVEFSGQETVIGEQVAADASRQVARTGKHALDFMMGAQKAMLEEMVFTGNELLERTRTEMHLFTEFVSKMAEAHSVRGIKAMCEECGQHQIEFLRRDSERVFKHGQRMIDNMSKLADDLRKN